LRCFVANLHAHSGAGCGDQQIAIPESSNQVKRLLRRPLVSETNRVVDDVLLDRFTHLRCRAKETISRHETIERLMRALKVVVMNEEADPLLAIGKVIEHCSRQEFVPQRFPETLDLPERHRMLRPALDMLDAVLLQRRFEFSFAAPRCVLSTVVRQQLFWRTVLGDPSLERFHNEAALLMVRHHVGHHEPRMIVHEADEVEALVLPQKEREDVRLPHLHWTSAFESPRWRGFTRTPWWRRVDAELVHHAPHLRLAHAQSFEAR
jgi:hypothetical protein